MLTPNLRRRLALSVSYALSLQQKIIDSQDVLDSSVLTTTLPFSEWTQVIPNARLCKALLDRITDRAHILETGRESYRFRRTAEKQKKGAKAT